MSDIRTLLDERARVWGEEIKPLVDKADWSAEDKAKFDAADARVSELTTKIDALRNKPEDPEPTAVPEPVASGPRKRIQDSDEYHNAFEKFLRYGDHSLDASEKAMIYNTQSTTTDSEGGYLISTGFEKDVIESRKAFGGLREVANVRNTSSGNTVEIPTYNGTGTVGSQIDQNTAATESAMAFGQKSWGAFKYTSGIVLHPVELLQDEEIGLEDLTNSALIERILRITHTHFTTGNGTTQPEGVVTAAAAGATAAAAAAISFTDFLNLEHSVDPAYRNAANCRFMFNDSTFKAAKALKDETNSDRPLWQPSVSVGAPDTINGYRYVVNQDMASVGASAKSVLFGDFSKFWIRDVRGMRIRRLAERYAEYDQVGFLAFSRHDSLLTDTAAVKRLTHPAS